MSAAIHKSALSRRDFAHGEEDVPGSCAVRRGIAGARGFRRARVYRFLL